MHRVALLALCAIGCGPAATSSPVSVEPVERAAVREAEATSLLAEPLFAPPLPDDVRVQREAELATAQTAFDADPRDLEAIIWLGRRTAYLGRYREAIEVFSAGLTTHPDAPELYRHRGHRFITTRALDKAVADLERAAALIDGKPDIVEQDGLPNAAGVPTGTLHTNVYYHLGLAHYLRGDFDRALRAYQACMKASTTDDMRVATSHWLYMTLRRLGRDDEAAALVAPVTADMTIYENHAYHRLLLMYRGDVAEGDLAGPDADAIEQSTLGYGLGNWQLVGGAPERAAQTFEAVIKHDNWAAFGFIAAEAELARLR